MKAFLSPELGHARRAPGGWRLLLADALRVGSRCLARWARRLAAARHVRERALPPVAPEYEFYAEAGAPEGAVYVNGTYLGHLPGVTRL